MKGKNQPNEKTKKESIFGVSSEKWVDLLLHTNAVIYNIHPFLCASVLCAVHTHTVHATNEILMLVISWDYDVEAIYIQIYLVTGQKAK